MFFQLAFAQPLKKQLAQLVQVWVTYRNHKNFYYGLCNALSSKYYNSLFNNQWNSFCSYLFIWAYAYRISILGWTLLRQWKKKDACSRNVVQMEWFHWNKWFILLSSHLALMGVVLYVYCWCAATNAIRAFSRMWQWNSLLFYIFHHMGFGSLAIG